MAPAPRVASLLVASLCTLLLAGCAGGDGVSNGPDGQSAAQDGNLAYNGASSGSHSSKFDCDGSAEVTFGSNLGGGGVTVTVKDAAGKTVYSKTANNVGQASDTKDVSGSDGEWTVSATRTSGFAGQYGVTVDC